MQSSLIRSDSWHFNGPSPQHAEPGPEAGEIKPAMPSMGDDAQPAFGRLTQDVAMPKAEAPAPGIPLRQESLETLEPSPMIRTKTLSASQTLFTDVLEQLSAKEESLPVQAALYSLPSMQFLESLLDEMDSRSASAGCQPEEPPLYVSGDAFDLPGLDASGSVANDISTAMGGQPMVPRRVHSASAAVGCAMGGDVAPVLRHPMHAATYGGYMAPTAGSAAPSPQRGIPPRAPVNRGPDNAASQARHAAAFLEELYGLEDNTEVTLQISKSGRVRNVTTFTGKRKADDMMMMSQASAPAVMCGEPLHNVQQHHNMHHSLHHMGSMGMEPETTSCFSEDMEANTEGPKRAVTKSKKSKRTVCLNCGSHQTPQWRCGPLGPRTLCNACGVRYKKGLPLNCWPLREGMVLPPGAVLPPTVQVPPGLNIITQPLDE